MTDIMLDIETLGTKPGCIVLSIGAVVFDRNTGETGKTFYTTVSIEDSSGFDLKCDAKTASWWANQSDHARYIFSDESQKTALGTFEAVESFVDWFRLIEVDGSWANGEVNVWAQGQDFDAPILAHVICLFEDEAPWEFRNLRDTRTVYDVCSFDTKSVTRDGTYHNALDDAKHQVKCLHAALKSRGLAQ